MAEYYFDIETYSPGERPNPDTDKIISIQFQRIDLRTGKPISDLVILKEWESSEEQILKEFYNKFFSDNVNKWNFIPVGFNLNFEWEFLISKFDKYLGKKFTSRQFHYDWPHIDLKSIGILLKNGNFKGTKLSELTNKQQDGKIISSYYKNKEFGKIEDYIKNETLAFLEFLQKVKSHLDTFTK